MPLVAPTLLGSPQNVDNASTFTFTPGGSIATGNLVVVLTSILGSPGIAPISVTSVTDGTNSYAALGNTQSSAQFNNPAFPWVGSQGIWYAYNATAVANPTFTVTTNINPGAITDALPNIFGVFAALQCAHIVRNRSPADAYAASVYNAVTGNSGAISVGSGLSQPAELVLGVFSLYDTNVPWGATDSGGFINMFSQIGTLGFSNIRCSYQLSYANYAGYTASWNSPGNPADPPRMPIISIGSFRGITSTGFGSIVG